MTELELRETVTRLAERYIGATTGDALQGRIVGIYNLYTPHPRGYVLKPTDSWCCAFVSAISIMANLTDIIPVECGCGEMVKLAKANGSWKGKCEPKKGDIVMYDWESKRDGWADHTGFVEEVGDNYITTIEGNATGGVCARRSVLKSDENILGYICPDYASKAGNKAFPFLGVVLEDVDTRTSPNNYGIFNLCNIECPTGSKIRHALFTGETVEIIGEANGFWQTKVVGRYTWTPFIAKEVDGKETIKKA